MIRDRCRLFDGRTTIGAVGSLLVVLFGVAGAACNESRGTASRIQGDASLHPVASIAADHLSHDFGAVVQGTRLAHVFRVTNPGTLPLTIERVERSYSCVVVGASTPILVAPSAGVDLPVQCDTTQRQGGLEEALLVHSNDLRSPALALHVEARIESLLAFPQLVVDLTTQFGVTRTTEVPLMGKLASDARLDIQQVEGSGVEVKVIDDNAPGQRLRFVLAGKQVGTGAGRVIAATGLSNPKQLFLSYSWTVTGNLEVDPPAPYMNLREPGPKELVLRIKSRRSDFRIARVRTLEGPFIAQFERDAAAGGYKVKVRPIESRIADDERSWLGKILLISNDPAEPQKELSLFALGRVNREMSDSDKP